MRHPLMRAFSTLGKYEAALCGGAGIQSDMESMEG